jgi:hypothetical protein
MKIFMIAIIWLLCGIVGGAGVNATLRAEFPTLNSARQRHKDAAMSFIMGITFGPVAFLSSAIVTGGYYDGFSFSFSPVENQQGVKNQ